MADIAIFHSVLGVRRGVEEAAERLRASGHRPFVVDQYEGRRFESYDEAAGYAESIGYPVLMQRALESVESLPDGFLAVGFSNGAGMAEYVALNRRVSAVVLVAGALPMAMLGASEWPAGVPAQIHYTHGDPFRNRDWLDALISAVEAAPAPCELHEYGGEGHLFTDPSLPDEYDPDAASETWRRILDFCEIHAPGSDSEDRS